MNNGFSLRAIMDHFMLGDEVCVPSELETLEVY